MNLLSVDKLSKSYGLKQLFKQISFGIASHQKVALVAKNGAGKTTLLNILTNADIADEGIVTFKRDINMAYVSQQPDFSKYNTVYDVALNPDLRQVKALKNYHDCLTAYSNDTSDQHLNKLEEAQNVLDSIQAWDYEQEIIHTLNKLNITDLDQTIQTLSGGQVKRLALGLALAQKPELLILDEPTNHLDIQMIEWLEQLLISSNTAMLLVTHDRYFLDRICQSIIELADMSAYRYDGNFSYYLEKKAEREAIKQAEIDKARNTYFKELEWVRRMPKARTTKSKSRLDAFDDIKTKALQKRKQQELIIQTKMNRLGSKIIEIYHLYKAFGDKKILNDFSYIFKRGEKLGIIGTNGVGKSTFLNIIMELEKADSGTIKHGDTIVYGYYHQQGLKLNEDKRAIDVIKDIADYIPLANGSTITASNLMTQFLFPPDMQHTFVSKLSGGEKRRLYLLTVLMKNPNFLILDEPTNDLDIETLAILENFLIDYSGCCMIVTHDRYFMDRLVDQLLIFKGDGETEFFPGNYSDYAEYLDAVDDVEQAPSVVKATPVVEDALVSNSNKTKMSYNERKEFETLESEIQVLENAKQKLETQLADINLSHDEIAKISATYQQNNTELETKTMRWLSLSELAQY